MTVFVGKRYRADFQIDANACLSAASGRIVLGSTVEHPATSACHRWAAVSGKTHKLIAHDDARGLVSAKDYAKAVTADTRCNNFATSPVTGMGMDVEAISKAIRAVAPDCFIIVDYSARCLG